MKEKIMAIALSMVMLLGGTSTAFASGSNDKVVSEDLAMAIAYDFLLSREENEDIIEKLPNDYNLILSKTIYETEGVPSAYKFDIEDEKDTYHGYIRFLYKGIIIKHNKTEPTYTKTSLFLCEKRRFFMARTEKGVVTTI